MRIKEFIFSGFITFSYENEFSTIKLIDGDNSINLVKKFRAIFDLFESEVSVSYFISDTKQTDDEMLEGWLRKLYGEIYADNIVNSYNYSSYTYGTDYDTYLRIGGHDLFHELLEYDKKWCSLKISIKIEEPTTFNF